MTAQAIELELPSRNVTIEPDYIFYQQQSTFARCPQLSQVPRHIAVMPYGIDVVNALISELYLVALTGYKGNYLPYNRLYMEELSSFDQLRIMMRSESKGDRDSIISEKHRYSFSYTYSLRIPPFKEHMLTGIMLQDLNHFFGSLMNVRGKIVSRQMKCLCLTHDSSIFIGNQSCAPYFKTNRGMIEINNGPLDQLVHYLDGRYMFSPGLPVLNKTGYEKPVTIKVEADFTKIENVNNSLKKYGLALREQNAIVNFMQLTQFSAAPKVEAPK